MPKLTPAKPQEVIRKLKKAGFEGPFPGGKHSFMRHPLTRVKISVPIHKGREIPIDTLRRIIDEAGLTVERWNEL